MITKFLPRIRSRHPSHNILRPRYNKLPYFDFKSIIRLGSTTNMKDTVTNGGNRIEINTIQAIENSANKLLMKHCFTQNNVKTADWWTFIPADNIDPYPDIFYNKINLSGCNISELPFPIISKHIHGSRGTGNKKHDKQESLESWMEGKNLDNYIFEKYYNYSREYRLHVTSEGCFYSCRKMIKNDTPLKDRWYRNDDHCVWIMEDNELFDKPVNWDDIVQEGVKALNAVGLDIGAIDLRIQSATNNKGIKRENPKFIIVEINSAPSFGDITAEKYIEELPKILNKKYNDK